MCDWKRERPTETGWYWVYDVDKDSVEIAQIIQVNWPDDDHYLGCEHSYDCPVGKNIFWGEEVSSPLKPNKDGHNKVMSTELRLGTGGRLIFQGELDEDKDLNILFEDCGYAGVTEKIFINKAAAIELIEHLCGVFEIENMTT